MNQQFQIILSTITLMVMLLLSWRKLGEEIGELFSLLYRQLRYCPLCFLFVLVTVSGAVLALFF